MMKGRIAMTVAAVLLSMQAFAQSTTEEFAARYQRQVRAVGQTGVGVEGILMKWEEAFPQDGTMLESKYMYYLEKGRQTEIVSLDLDKFQGNKPFMTLKDDEGKDVKYFEKTTYLDEYFSQACDAIDKAIELYPTELGYRADLITALFKYEGDAPDMAARELEKLIVSDKTKKSGWTFQGEAISDEEFLEVVQEYCFRFFQIASPVSFEYFRSISELVLGIHQNNTVFMSNIGSYYTVAAKNDKMGLKWYNKVLKVNPEDYIAAKNCVIIARRQKNVKMEKKYLPALIANSPDETEKTSCRMRLEALSKM